MVQSQSTLDHGTESFYTYDTGRASLHNLMIFSSLLQTTKFSKKILEFNNNSVEII